MRARPIFLNVYPPAIRDFFIMRYSVLIFAFLGTVSFSSAHGRREFTNYESTTAAYHSSESDVQGAFRKRATPAEDAMSAASEHLDHIAPGTHFRVSDQYTDKDTGVTHVYFVQSLNDLDIENARANINVSRGTLL